MILIIANEASPFLLQLTAKWPDCKAALLTVEDLLQPGWQLNNTAFEKGTLVASGKAIAVAEIKGVLNLITAVTENDLYIFNDEDRKYALHELNAFLAYFFSNITVPVVNSLMPAAPFNIQRRYEEIIMHCRSINIPVQDIAYNSAFPQQQYQRSNPQSVFVFATHYFDEHHLLEEAKATALVKWLGVNYAELVFEETGGKYFFTRVNYIPDLTRSFILNAITTYLN